MSKTIALVGNPNSGKTTLFNALTGANQYVGNWPGVTVEKKTGKLKGHEGVELVDLPGIYSLSPYTLEEVVARNYIIDEKPDALINIVDGSNLERNLYLSTQALELGIPTVIAVNMMDVVDRQGDYIDMDALSEKMGCPVVAISALKGTGIDEVIATAVELAEGDVPQTRVHEFSAGVENLLGQVEAALAGKVPETMKRFFAVKSFERDNKIAEHINGTVDVESIIKAAEADADDDAESIIVNERYNYITKIIGSCYTKAVEASESISDKIDKVVTNRVLAIPIFVAVMFLVYYISVTTVGGWATDWANDGVFGDGWFLTPQIQEAYDEANEDAAAGETAIEAFHAAAEEAGLEVPEDLEDTNAVATFTKEAASRGVYGYYDDYDDETGENTLVAVVADEASEGAAPSTIEGAEVGEVAHYDESVTAVNEAPDPSQFGVFIPGIPAIVEGWLDAGGVNDQVKSLVLDGIIGGVGSVLGFVPQLLVLFAFLAFLEASGYMARVAFILDRVFRRFGLSGKSFIPILIGTGCGIPGVMASRTIEAENDRRMTVMTTTFIPCGAKLPIIALFAGAIFAGAWWVAPSAYFLGLAAILISGIILKKTKPFAGKVAPFVMELPAYRLPTIGAILRSMWERAWSFIKKAGTIIFAAVILVWFLSNYGFVDGSFGWVDDQGDSLLAVLGNAVAWIFAPLGFSNWQAAAATVTGLIAKENVVGTFGVLYAGGAGWFANVQAAYTPLMAYSFLAFNLLCAPCFAAMGAIRREMNSAKWFWAAIGYQCGLAYCVSLCIYQIGGLIMGEVAFNFFTVVAFALVAAMLYLLFRPNRQDTSTVNYAVSAAKAA
ncbi:MAG: ferrous iron transporter B [Eggerthellaceae bacterium]|nr:ferrous iron transporter B [Eggerthellaceae bacterium]